jgi:hypothetical protein
MSLLTRSPLSLERSRSMGDRCSVIVAGPGSSFTVPGLIVSEIVQAFSRSTPTTRIEVDVNSHLLTGLHRAPSLSAAHEPRDTHSYNTFRASSNARKRGQLFRGVIGKDIATVVAYAWPGIDNSWIKQFCAVGRAAGATTVVACASLPQPGHASASSLETDTFAFADAILIGDENQARDLRRKLGHWGPGIECHPALSLEGRNGRQSRYEITAFLPKDGVDTLKTVLDAFDAIPEAWIHEYKLHVVMRYNDRAVAALVNDGYHRKYVELVGDQMSSTDLEKMVSTSSAVSVATPEVDSRVFSTAMDSGIGTVVMGDAQLPKVGRGYVGGLMADARSPSSLYVALRHALRLGDLRFPAPSSWDGLAERLSPFTRDTSSESVTSRLRRTI